MEFRPLTRREQLEYLLEFLKQQKEQIEQEIQVTEKEYRLVLEREREK